MGPCRIAWYVAALRMRVVVTCAVFYILRASHRVLAEDDTAACHSPSW